MAEETIPRYEIEIFWSDEDEAYVAVVPDLPYCSAWGETYEEALAQAQDAIRGHIEVRRETGRPIPEPRSHHNLDMYDHNLDVYEQPARRVDEAAREFAEAVRESYQTVSDRSMEAQERSRMLTQNFFESVIDELEARAQSGQQMSEELREQSRRQQEAFQQLSEESMNAYREFMNSMLTYYQMNAERARRSTER